MTNPRLFAQRPGNRVVWVSALLLIPGLLMAASLKTGPMIGHTTTRTVNVWVQTDAIADVAVQYWPADAGPAEGWISPTVVPLPENGFVVTVPLREGLEPGKAYGYTVLIDGQPTRPRYREGYTEQGPIPMRFKTRPRWRWIPDTAASERTGNRARHSIFDFSIAMGSCAYVNQPGYDREGGDPYGGDYRIFEHIYEQAPDIMLWLGDNVYYREDDWDTRHGMIQRWTHDRSILHLQPLLANAIHLATWDDHDYGPNDIGRTFEQKGLATEIFNLFYDNPSAGLPELPGIFTFYNYGDVNLYLLDNRTYRTSSTADPVPFDGPREIIGKDQIDWLVEHMAWAQSQMENDRRSYPARWNLVAMGSQFLADTDSPHALRSAPREYQYLLDRLVHAGIDNVFFLSGDVHFGEVNQVTYIGQGQPGVPGKAGAPGHPYVFTEITSSPLTAGSWPGPADNDNRLDIFDDPEIDRVGQRNFATLTFTGSLDDRQMVLRYFDSDGNLLNQKVDAPAGTPTDASVFSANEGRAPRVEGDVR
ncbi:MAG: alkaline phosphatase D family protein [Opitutales bacterium]